MLNLLSGGAAMGRMSSGDEQGLVHAIHVDIMRENRINEILRLKAKLKKIAINRSRRKSKNRIIK